MNAKKKTTGAIDRRWVLVAELLCAARVQAGFQRRTYLVNHLVENQIAKPSIDRILGDLERGARDNYSLATLAAVEAYYQIPAGEIGRTLRGPAPTTLPPASTQTYGYGDGMPTMSDLIVTSTHRLMHLAMMIVEELAERADPSNANPGHPNTGDEEDGADETFREDD